MNQKQMTIHRKDRLAKIAKECAKTGYYNSAADMRAIAKAYADLQTCLKRSLRVDIPQSNVNTETKPEAKTHDQS